MNVKLHVRLASLVGVYTASTDAAYFVRVVFEGSIEGGGLQPGADTLTTQWRPVQEIKALPDDDLDGHRMLRRILADVAGTHTFDLETLREFEPVS